MEEATLAKAPARPAETKLIGLKTIAESTAHPDHLGDARATLHQIHVEGRQQHLNEDCRGLLEDV